MSDREAIYEAVREGLYKPPQEVGSLRPWAPLFVPPQLTGRVLGILLPALVALDADYLREHPETPPIYRSGVRYVPEPPGQEQWLTVPFVLMRGQGDCEDLACWRCAELRVRAGENARVFATSREVDTPKGRVQVYHIRVRRSSGKIEDPSVMLGMGAEMASHWGETHSIADGERA